MWFSPSLEDIKIFKKFEVEIGKISSQLFQLKKCHSEVLDTMIKNVPNFNIKKNIL